MEDIEVVKKKRGQGIGTSLTKLVKKRAKEFGCRKLIINSRDSRRKVHKLYKKLGFRKHGKEFRIDF
jgi:GNAT superfamily N-acetyltransferase